MLLQRMQLIAWCQVGERFEEFIHHLLFPFFSFQALFFFTMTHYCANYFQCIYECTTPVITFFVDRDVWEYACFKLALDRTP